MVYIRFLILFIAIGNGFAPNALGQALEDARSLHREGQTEEALEAYRALLNDAEASVADQGTAANNACVILLNEGAYAEARLLCERARDIRLSLGDSPRLARSLNNLAAVLEGANDYRAAERTYREAIALNEASGDTQSLAINFANLGVLATQTGQFGSALRYYDRVAEIAARHADEGWAAEQARLAAINRGVVLERIGAFREALEEFRTVDPAAMDSRRAATLHINTGVAYRNIGSPRRALEAFERAARLLPADDRDAQANLWLDRGLVHHLNLYNYDQALTDYRTALEHAAASTRRTRLTVLNHLARLQLDRNEIGPASAHYEQSLSLAREIGSLEAQWSALEGLARLALQQSDPVTARERLEQAMQLIESVRGGFDSGRHRLDFFGSQRTVYALAVDVAWALRDGDPAAGTWAYEVCQRAKARELLSSISEGVAPAGPGDGLIEYFFGEESLYAWVVNDGNTGFHRIGDSSAMREAVVSVRLELASGQASPAMLEPLSILLPAATVDAVPDGSILRIAPDDVLFHIPFSMLPFGGAQLGTRYAISYLPSGSIGASLRSRPLVDPDLTFAGIGAPPSSDFARFALAPLDTALAELERLDKVLPGSHRLITGTAATESTLQELPATGVVHIASHTVFDDRLGSAIVLAPDSHSDGLLYPSEIAATPRRSALTVLAACTTSPGGVADGRAILSLSGALMAAGSDAVLATLWDVEDRYTAYFMELYYDQLLRGKTPVMALHASQALARRDADSQDYRWSAFVLWGDSQPPFRAQPDYRFLVAGVALLLLALVLGRRLRE